MTARFAGDACTSVQHGHCMVVLRTMQSKQRTSGRLAAPGRGRRWITTRATLVQRRSAAPSVHWQRSGLVVSTMMGVTLSTLLVVGKGGAGV